MIDATDCKNLYFKQAIRLNIRIGGIILENIIFEDKNEMDLMRFYYYTKGVYSASSDILQNDIFKLNNLLEYKDADKLDIKKMREKIKKTKIQIEIMERLYGFAFHT